MRIGLLGGTFNPIHKGHLVLAQECLDRLDLDKVIFIPAYIPPLKEVKRQASPADRLEMVCLALKDDDRFEVSTYEIDREKTSYSIDTIKHFKEEYKDTAELFFLTGADSAKNLSMWKDIDDILRLTTFVIATRPGCEESTPYEEKLQRISIPDVEISSSMVRERVKNHEPIDRLIPASVAQYIQNKKLYKE